MRIWTTGLCLLCLAAPLQATELSVGAGIQAAPRTPGSDDWRLLPAPSFQLDIDGYRLATRGPGLGADLAPSPALSLGPFAHYSGGRDTGDLDGADLPTVPASVETGVSLGSGLPWSVLGVPLPGILTAEVAATTTLPGGHESPYASASLGWVAPATERWTLIASLGLSYFGDDYADRFFSLDTEAAATAGLPAFDAGPGWQDLNLTLVSSYAFRPRWSAVTVAGYNRYLGDAEASPITRTLDSRDRYMLVLGVSYQWLTGD